MADITKPLDSVILFPVKCLKAASALVLADRQLLDSDNLLSGAVIFFSVSFLISRLAFRWLLRSNGYADDPIELFDVPTIFHTNNMISELIPIPLAFVFCWWCFFTGLPGIILARLKGQKIESGNLIKFFSINLFVCGMIFLIFDLAAVGMGIIPAVYWNLVLVCIIIAAVGVGIQGYRLLGHSVGISGSDYFAANFVFWMVFQVIVAAFPSEVSAKIMPFINPQMYIFTSQNSTYGEMYPTIPPGATVLINRFSYAIDELKRGDVVAFYDEFSQIVTSRIIALPREEVEFKNGQIYVDEVPAKRVPVKLEIEMENDAPNAKCFTEAYKEVAIPICETNPDELMNISQKFQVPSDQFLLLPDLRAPVDYQSIGEYNTRSRDYVLGKVFYVMAPQRRSGSVFDTIHPETKKD